MLYDANAMRIVVVSVVNWYLCCSWLPFCAVKLSKTRVSIVGIHGGKELAAGTQHDMPRRRVKRCRVVSPTGCAMSIQELHVCFAAILLLAFFAESG